MNGGVATTYHDLNPCRCNKCIRIHRYWIFFNRSTLRMLIMEDKLRPMLYCFISKNVRTVFKYVSSLCTTVRCCGWCFLTSEKLVELSYRFEVSVLYFISTEKLNDVLYSLGFVKSPYVHTGGAEGYPTFERAKYVWLNEFFIVVI